MRDGQWKNFFVTNKTEDFCAYTRQPSFMYVIHLFYTGMFKNGNIPNSCPFQKVIWKHVCSKIYIKNLKRIINIKYIKIRAIIIFVVLKLTKKVGLLNFHLESSKLT